MQNTTRGTAGSLEKLMAPRRTETDPSGKIFASFCEVHPNPVIISPTLAFLTPPDKITMWGRCNKVQMVGSGRKMVLRSYHWRQERLKMEPGRQLQKFPKGMWTKLSRAVLRKGKGNRRNSRIHEPKI